MSDTKRRPDLALIHGWGLGSAAWEPMLEPLSEHCHVHRVDLPGYGDAPDSNSNFVHTAQTMLATLPDGITLCGWSLGSMLALQMALLAPQRINGMILIGSTPCFTQRDNWPDAQAPALLDTFCDAVSREATSTLQRFIALLNQGDTMARPIGRAMAKQMLASPLPDTATLITGLGWLRDVDLRQQIDSIEIPTLLIHGENDPLMPLPAAQWLKNRLPRAQLEIVSGAAHAPFFHDPEQIAKRIGDHCHASALH